MQVVMKTKRCMAQGYWPFMTKVRIMANDYQHLFVGSDRNNIEVPIAGNDY